MLALRNPGPPAALILVVMGFVTCERAALAADDEAPGPGSASATAEPVEPATEEDVAPVEGSAEVLVASSYVWRGDLYSEDLFDPNVQPYADLTLNELGPGYLTASVWAFLPTTGGAFEVDPAVAYGVSLGDALDLELGYTVYVALNPVEDYMHEVFLDLTVTAGLPVNPIAGVAVDPVRTLGAYAYAGAAFSVEGERLGLEAQATAGLSGAEGVEVGFQDITVTAIGSVFLTETFYASLVAGFGYAARTQDANPWGGLAFGAGF